MVRGVPTGMGISPKSETRCHNFSFFGLEFFKNEKLWQHVSYFREMPIPVGARSTMRRFLNVWFRPLKQRPGPELHTVLPNRIMYRIMHNWYIVPV